MNPPSVLHLTEADLNAQALDHECPACGAAPTVRCRIISRTYHGRTKVDVRRKPCPERTTAAWRKWMAEVAAG